MYAFKLLFLTQISTPVFYLVNSRERGKKISENKLRKIQKSYSTHGLNRLEYICILLRKPNICK